jgi:thiamine kinase-like enzyme
MNKQTGNVHEIENLEELRRFDPSYNEASNNKVLETIADVFNVPEKEICDIEPIKIGMTNRSFIFTHDNSRYIMRIPGEGTELLIDRQKEFNIYEIIAPLKICDDLIYIDPKEGYKITKFLEDSRVCDPFHLPDVKACMAKLKEFHNLKLSVDHTFDLFERIEYYESLWQGKGSYFRDYKDTKTNVLKLRKYIESMPKEWILSHIDAVPDNFIFEKTGDGETIRLIDWEYSGMQDPHIDIAMFAVYSMYDRKHVEQLIDCYFDNDCRDDVRLKVYAYIAACGLLWSNWCEYKSHLGVEFGEYALLQYRFAKDYYKIFVENSAPYTK